MSERTYRRHGWKPSLPDFRDFVADTSQIMVKEEVDPRDRMTEVYDQGQLGSCTANAVAAAIDYDRIVNGESPFYPSRLAIYWLERFIEGSPADQDTGAYGRDGFRAARRYGMIPEQDQPYEDSASATWFQQDPRKLGAWKQDRLKLERPYKAVPRTAHNFRQVLSNDQVIIFGFSVYESFESLAVARTGVVPILAANEQQLGGHEVVCVGYLKEHPHFFLCRNSWGSDWGLGGYFLFPIQLILDSRFSSDFRTIYQPLA